MKKRVLVVDDEADIQEVIHILLENTDYEVISAENGQEAQVFWERIVGYPDVADFQAEIAGRTIEGVRRRGKYLLIDLSAGLFLTIHRRMTGNFYLLPHGWNIDTSLRETDPAAWSTKG